MSLSLVPDLTNSPTPPVVAHRLRAYQFTLGVWQRKLDHAKAMLAAATTARENYIASLPELPAWITERGEIGADCPDDAA